MSFSNLHRFSLWDIGTVLGHYTQAVSRIKCIHYVLYCCAKYLRHCLMINFLQ